jgi:hypothetical protein
MFFKPGRIRLAGANKGKCRQFSAIFTTKWGIRSAHVVAGRQLYYFKNAGAGSIEKAGLFPALP